MITIPNVLFCSPQFNHNDNNYLNQNKLYIFKMLWSVKMGKGSVDWPPNSLLASLLRTVSFHRTSVIIIVLFLLCFDFDSSFLVMTLSKAFVFQDGRDSNNSLLLAKKRTVIFIFVTLKGNEGCWVVVLIHSSSLKLAAKYKSSHI